MCRCGRRRHLSFLPCFFRRQRRPRIILPRITLILLFIPQKAQECVHDEELQKGFHSNPANTREPHALVVLAVYISQTPPPCREYGPPREKHNESNTHHSPWTPVLGRPTPIVDHVYATCTITSPISASEIFPSANKQTNNKDNIGIPSLYLVDVSSAPCQRHHPGGLSVGVPQALLYSRLHKTEKNQKKKNVHKIRKAIEPENSRVVERRCLPGGHEMRAVKGR